LLTATDNGRLANQIIKNIVEIIRNGVPGIKCENITTTDSEVRKMSTKQEEAVASFIGGFNCAQAVLSVFCEKYGLDQETALKTACGLGGGFRSAEVCGAASGAVLAIGLRYGQNKIEDTASKVNCYAKTEEFLNAFKAENSSIICREILCLDISTEDGRAQAISRDLFKVKCPELVRSAVCILEQLGY